MDIAGWLRGLGLAQYQARFREHEVDAEVLPELTEADLEALGIPLGHRKRLLKAIRALQAEADQPPVPPFTPRPLDAPHPAERRQLTVMFCDLVGSTALSTRLDPEDLREVIASYHQIVAETVRRFDGFVAQYMGDGVLVYFGYPRAHEDDAERAVRASLDVVAAIERLAVPTDKLKVRVGIATGPVVVGDLVGEGISEEHAVIGETPNLAARLQALAQPGTIVLPAATRSLLGNLFKLRDLGRYELKGLTEPVEAWAVEGVSVFETRFELLRSAQLSAFVGREAEIGLLMDRWDLARNGEGQVVLLSGEPGIGKSRILNELRARLDKEQVTALRFQCSPYYLNSAFYPIIDNFERALKFARDEMPEQKLDKLETLIVSDYGRPWEDVRFIASILSIPCEERYGALTITPQKFKDETLRALVDIVEAAARKQPSVMLFEDAHWADPSSLEVIDLVVDRVARIPLLVVLTHRPEFQSRWSHYSHVTGLTLTRLTRTQSSALVSRLTDGKALPPDLLEQILSKTDGVPLFIEELTKSILESAALEDAGDRYTYSGDARTLTIPISLRDSLMSRLDRLMPVKEVAQIGAAIGHHFSYDRITAVASRSKSELDQALGQLIASGLAFRQGTPPDAIYSFKHALVRDAAYESLLKSRRQQLHARIAQELLSRFPERVEAAPELVAQHLTEAALAERAIDYWLRAGERAAERSANIEAVGHLNRGLKLLNQIRAAPTERARRELALRLAMGGPLIATKGYAAAETVEAYGRARELCEELDDSVQLLSAVFGEYAARYMRSELSEMRSLAARFSELAEADGRQGVRLIAKRMQAVVQLHSGDLISAKDSLETILTRYDPERHRGLALQFGHDTRAASLAYLSWTSWCLGYPEQAVAASEAAIAWSNELSHANSKGIALCWGGVFPNLLLRRPNEAEFRAQELIRFCDETRLPRWGAYGRFCIGWARLRQGDVEYGLAEMVNGLADLRDTGSRRFLLLFLAWTAEAQADAGIFERAERTIAEAFADLDETGDVVWTAELHRARAAVMARGNAKEQTQIEDDLQRAIKVAHDQQAKSLELRSAMSYARLMQDQARTKEAYELLAPIYDWFTEGFNTKDLQDAGMLLEELAPGSKARGCPPSRA